MLYSNVLPVIQVLIIVVPRATNEINNDKIELIRDQFV